ncbi:hypothetical protein FRC11_001728 [Ceratobasidium sp. 423]|nr:hypothetical protein FRC11_001728 [Ceratobasidium sp. 423]
MDGAYIMAGRKKPDQAVMQHIANSEYFKYLSKKSKRSNVAGDGFKHHPLSSSFFHISESPPEQPNLLPTSTSSPPTQEPGDNVVDEMMDLFIKFPES